MEELNECIMHYIALLNALEEDTMMIRQGFGGDLLDAYRTSMQRELMDMSDEVQRIRMEWNGF